MGTMLGKMDTSDLTAKEQKNLLKYCGNTNPTKEERLFYICSKKESIKAKKKGLWK